MGRRNRLAKKRRYHLAMQKRKSRVWNGFYWLAEVADAAAPTLAELSQWKKLYGIQPDRIIMDEIASFQGENDELS